VALGVRKQHVLVGRDRDPEVARAAPFLRQHQDAGRVHAQVRLGESVGAHRLDEGLHQRGHLLVPPAQRRLRDLQPGQWAPGQRQVAASAQTPFDEVAARWLAHVEPTIDPRTFRLYRDTYVGSHFSSFFKWFEQLTTVGVQNYTSARLKKVTRQTIKHELSALRRLTKWAHERGYLTQLPHVETPGRRVLGTPVPSARKRVSLIFTPSRGRTTSSPAPTPGASAPPSRTQSSGVAGSPASILRPT
jgi:hypothetical protein